MVVSARSVLERPMSSLWRINSSNVLATKQPDAIFKHKPDYSHCLLNTLCGLFMVIVLKFRAYNRESQTINEPVKLAPH